MLKMMPRMIPPMTETTNLIMISLKTMSRIFLALNPIARSILYISASYLHLPSVYKKMKIVTRVLITAVISTI
jgi:hypothetical protein